MSSNISSVRHAASETGSIAHQVLAVSNELSKGSDMLRQYVERFLQSIRAA